MSKFVQYVEGYGSVFVLLLLCVALVAFLCQWVLWMFGLGRFKQQPPATAGEPDSTGARGAPIRYLLAELVAGIITEFRHLLALVVVTLFATALMFAMYAGFKVEKIDGMIEGVQAVAAVLGGLLGSIIGYYFGESAARAEPPAGEGQDPSQSEDDGEVLLASAPPDLEDSMDTDEPADPDEPVDPEDSADPEDERA